MGGGGGDGESEKREGGGGCSGVRWRTACGGGRGGDGKGEDVVNVDVVVVGGVDCGQQVDLVVAVVGEEKEVDVVLCEEKERRK